ncbi:MAG: phosphatase PAP2 family protein [Capsulimonadales bacterium]|nr:phosphatase PAP2 family protein [Capsulimonadales bacterium]
MGLYLQMVFGRRGREFASTLARKVGRRVRKYIAPAAPFIITPVALGAAVSAGAVAFFLNLADDIRQQDGVWHFDHDGLKMALALRNPRRTALMKTASNLARLDMMSAIGLIALLISLRFPRQRPRGILLAVALSGGGLIIGGMKTRYARERPTLIEALATEGTFSFPSGHAFISLTFYGILANWWVRSHSDWRERFLGIVLASQAISLIGASRVYLGVHYPSDVLAGYAAAIPWLTACLVASDQYEKRLAKLPPRAVGLLSAREDDSPDDLIHDEDFDDLDDLDDLDDSEDG